MILSFALTFFFVLSFCAAAIAQTSPRKDFPGVTIKNFGQMDERFYRGARPKEGKGQYAALKALGIQTVIDLTDDAEPYAKAEAEGAGLRYVNLPIIDKSYPTPENVEAFLKLVDDQSTGVFYLHCAGGRHRTGDMGALYRFVKYGWGFDQAYEEMKNYDFYSSWGHGKQKDFVEDYAVKYEAVRRMKEGETAAASQKGN
jgi:protein tyrosine/serine phosphatase